MEEVFAHVVVVNDVEGPFDEVRWPSSVLQLQEWHHLVCSTSNWRHFWHSVAALELHCSDFVAFGVPSCACYFLALPALIAAVRLVLNMCKKCFCMAQLILDNASKFLFCSSVIRNDSNF